MIPISVPQKQIVLDFFDDDIKIVKKYFNAIGFDFDESFEFSVFKDFIYAAAGMFKDLDMTIYNQELVSKFKTIQYLSEEYNEFEQRSQFALKVYIKNFLGAQEAYMAERKIFNNLKTELQALIAKEQSMTAKRELMEAQLKDIQNPIPKEDMKAFEEELKKVRRDQVDAIHMIGSHKRELEERQTSLKEFEDQHREEFLHFFNEVKEKLTHQYTQSLNYFGYEFNEALFRNSEKSAPIQRFKKDAGITGDLNLCKYVEYYLRNVVAEALADANHKERLLRAKRYCEKKGNH